MAVVRGSQPRMAEMFFYSHFKKIGIDFIGDKRTGWVVDKKIPKNINYIDLKLKPKWGIDPITGILGPSHAHRSWQVLEGLEENLKAVDAINISDTFYFYCGQSAELAKKLGKKLVVVTWETIPHHPSTYLPPYSFNVEKVIDNADLFIARSQKAREYLLSIGADPAKIKVIYKGIHIQDFMPKIRKPDGKIRLLYVGQLVESKGLSKLLDAFTKLSKEFNNLELWICARSAGEPLEEKIKKLAKNYAINWLGNVSYDEIPSVYQQCDIYCQLSQDWKYFGLLPGGNEWFSYSIMEAMASGLPVVATGVGGIPEEIGNDNIMVEQKSVESAYSGIKDLILNPAKIEEIGRKNVLRAKRLFDMEVQAEKTENAIMEILK